MQFLNDLGDWNQTTRGIYMNEGKKHEPTHSRYVKIGIWIILSALILTGLAIIVGVAFEEIRGEQASIEEIVYLPQQHDYSRGTSTLSYSMAARYSDGSLGSLPEVNEDFATASENENASLNIENQESEDTRGEPEEFTFTYTGRNQSWKPPSKGVYEVEITGAGGRGHGGARGGKGGKVTGLVTLEDKNYIIVVGGTGGSPDSNRSASGAGGFSGITENGNQHLISAGGGGGAGSSYGSGHGGDGGYPGKNGTNGGGGSGGAGGSVGNTPAGGAGGAGHNQNGQPGTSSGGGRGGTGGSSQGAGGGGGGYGPAAGPAGGCYSCGGCPGAGGYGGGGGGGGGGCGGGNTRLSGAGGGGGGFRGGTGGRNYNYNAGNGGGGGGGGANYADPDITDDVVHTTGGGGSPNGHGKVIIRGPMGNYADYGFEYKEGSGVSYTFTNCGATQYYGPTQGQINSSYANTNLAGKVTVNQRGFQEWVVPETDTYTIETWGARGGYGTSYNDNGGKGARMKGEFQLNKNDRLKIVVGQKGGNGYGSGGGGGGTYVVMSNNSPLIIAGGGGAGQYGGGVQNYQHGTTSNNGQSTNRRSGGRNGYGGDGDYGSGCCGGGGLLGDGGRGSYGNPGRAFIYGAEGGRHNYYGFSGFGGGGGTHGNSGGGGGGGGYSGGAGGYHDQTWGNGGGGGSYNKGANKSDSIGVNNDHGKVVISTQPEILNIFYLEPFSEDFKDTEFGTAWSTYSSDEENARNERIDTEPGLKEKGKYTFTNCGVSGAQGPTQGQVNSTYANTNLKDQVKINTRGIQEWTAPENGKYTIEVWGAEGGNHRYGTGGYGARMKGDFDLTKGTVLKILVGQKGSDGSSWAAGGGGTFVAKSNNTPLIVAGGGGSIGNCGGGNKGRQDGQADIGNGNGGYSGNNGRWCGCGGEGSGGGGFNGDGGGNGGKSFKNGGVGCTSRRPGQCIGPGTGGFGGGGNGGNGGGGGGGYEGGRAGGPSHSYALGGKSYNDGTNKDNTSGVNQGHGKVQITLFEQINDPGFDAYDPEERGTSCWVMDTAEARGPNLNQLLFHIGLDAGEDSVTSLRLSFAAKVYGNTDAMPSSFGENMLPHNYDGVSVSIDNENWYKVWSPNASADWAMMENKNLLGFLPNGSVEAKEDLYIRFSQYGSGKIDSEGILWDEINLVANPEVEFNFDVPELLTSFEYEPDPFIIYAKDQGDPDSASVKFTLKGKGGSGAGAGGGAGSFQSFTDSGSFTVPKGVSSVRVLVVGGGGGGSGSHYGGGGSGHVKVGTYNVNQNDNIAVQVGSSGTGGVPNTNNAPGGNGGASSFGNHLSAPGGNGGPRYGGGGNGGSGGGGGGNSGYAGAGGSNGSNGSRGRSGGGGSGGNFDSLDRFTENSLTPGAGGAAGNSSHSGGGGGGGVLMNGSGPSGGNGGESWSGKGGQGYGGGGGAGGYQSGRRPSGGAGAKGLVYVEWGGGRGEPVLYKFTSCGRSSTSAGNSRTRDGPSQGEINAAYSGTNLQGLVTSRSGIQEWTVPGDGSYEIEVWGARGWHSSNGNRGMGARMKGTFALKKGEKLRILVGQEGTGNGGGGDQVAGGGGGTFVVTANNTPLIIAGGGGGSNGSNYSNSRHASAGKNGQNPYPSGGRGGSNGNGGGGDRAGGGGGLRSNGGRGGYDNEGRSFLNGGKGGYGDSQYGGFGGGGGGGNDGAGGGGGYSGGGGTSGSNGSAGGGGSYNDGEDPSNSGGVNDGPGKVNITYVGGGEPVAEEVRFKFEKAEGILIDDDPNVEEVTWSSDDENEDDVVGVGDEYDIEFDVSSADGFYGSIGKATLTYKSWDGDEVEYEFKIPNLRIQAFAYAKMEGEVIANNGGNQNDPGSLLTLESYDDQDPPGVMPAQEYTKWRAADLGDSVEFVDAIDEKTGKPFTHKKIIRVTGGTPGDTGTVFVTHKASGEEDGYPVTLTSGPVAQGTIYTQESYVVGETGVISVALEDAYGNACVDWKDRMYVKVTEGKVEFEDEMDEDGKGNYYLYTDKDKGVHDFIITPLTFHAVGPTVIEFETVAVPIGEPASLKVVAGPGKSLHVDYDPKNMPGWDGSYYAGEELYFTIYGTDKMGNPSSTYDAPIIVTHDFKTENKEHVPEPWQSSDGSVILNMVKGVATNYPAQPIKFYGAGEVSLTFRSKVNLEGIQGYTKKITVNPTYLDHLEALPGGPDAAPVTVDVNVGETQLFTVLGFDEFNNPIEIESTTWRADSDIKAKETPDVLNNGEFKAIEYFGPEDDDVIFDTERALSTRKGNVEVTAVCPRDQREIKRDISVRVLNDKDVWLDANDILPEHILVGHEMNFKANIYYNMPVTDPGTRDQSSALGDLFEVTVIVSLVDKDGKNPIELAKEPIRFEDLNTNPESIENFNVKIPWESFSDHIKRWEDGNDDTKNYLLVEVDEVIGGTDMKLFEKTNDNNRVTVELYAVRAPAASQTPSFAPSVAAMGIALLGLAVGSTFYSGKRRKKGYRGDREAVSPVIAIILMVAITIVLAGVLWLWVSGLVDTGKEDGVGGIVNVEPDTRTVNKDYVLKVETLTAENDLSVEDLRFTLFSSDRRDMSNGQHRVSNVYGKPIDDQTFISFRDGDHDGKLSIGDRFVIKSFEHVDDDGSTDSPGFAEPGFFFELRAGKRLLFEEQIK